MNKLYFQGYSDDTFSCQGNQIDCALDNCASGEPIVMLVSAADGQCFVTGQFCPGESTGWQISVAPSHPEIDDVGMPSWPMRFKKCETPYSPELVIEAPDDVKVVLMFDGQETAK